MKKSFLKIGTLALIAAIAGLLQPACAQSAFKLEALGEVVIPYNYQFDGTPVGGLSGLTYDPQTQRYYVISDDKSEFSDARFYSLRLQLNRDGKLTREGLAFEDVAFLKTAADMPYPEGKIDPEGIAVGPDSLMYISSEGDTGIGVAPFINVYRRDGTMVRKLNVPPAYWNADRKEHGIRENFGFEGLAISPDGTRLYAGLENALHQDGPPADTSSASPSRIIVYALPSGEILHEYTYRVDPVYTTGGARGDLAVNGLTDMVVLEQEGVLLTIDRNYVAGQGTHISLYEVKTQAGTDIKGAGSIRHHSQEPRNVRKELVANLRDFGITLDNFEGLVLGPELPEGGRLLLMVSDNNFSDVQQTLFTAFRLYTDQLGSVRSPEGPTPTQSP